MTRRISGSRSLLALALPLLGLALSCATAPTAPTADPNLIDPRTGFRGATSQSVMNRFEKAWSRFQLGYDADAQKRFASLLDDAPGYLPAKLGLAAIAIQNNDVDRAESLVVDVARQGTDYFAADLYRAEIAIRRGKLEAAHDIYRTLASRPEATAAVRERAARIARDLFDSLFARASREPDVSRSIAYLRQALTVLESPAARLSLVQKLIEVRKFEDARRQITPLLQQGSGKPEIEQALAEIEVGTGEYEAAISRLERLSRTSPGARVTALLAEVKQKWMEANMPPQYNAAVESLSVTRAQLAVLLYWRLPAVRFAQNLAEPPIAIDVDVVGREELVRALAMRLFPVDPITRQAYPDRRVGGAGVARIVSRILSSRGVGCAQAAREEPSEAARAQIAFAHCGLASPEFSSEDSDVSGRAVVVLLDRVARLLASSEQ